MSSAISASNFIEAMKGWSSEELEQVRSALQALAPKKEKVAKAPAAPVLDPAYVVAEPATKGIHKGKPRWQNTDTENYVYEFPAVAPAAKKAAKAPAPAAKPAPAAASSGDLTRRMTKEEVAALSKEEKKERTRLKKEASEERKKNRSPEDQAKIDAKVAKMQAARAANKNKEGGSAEAEAEEDSGSGSAADE